MKLQHVEIMCHAPRNAKQTVMLWLRLQLYKDAIKRKISG